VELAVVVEVDVLEVLSLHPAMVRAAAAAAVRITVLTAGVEIDMANSFTSGRKRSDRTGVDAGLLAMSGHAKCLSDPQNRQLRKGEHCPRRCAVTSPTEVQQLRGEQCRKGYAKPAQKRWA